MWYICIKDVVMKDNGVPTGEVAFAKGKIYDWRRNRDIEEEIKSYVTTDDLWPSQHVWLDIHNDPLFKRHFKRYRKPRIREVDPKEFVIGKYL